MAKTHHDQELHRYFDGELSPEEAAELRRALEVDPALGARLAGLEEVRAAVRAASLDGAELDEAGSAELWARVEAGIAGGKADRPALRLRALAGGRSRRTARRIGVVLTASAALAAAALVVFLRPEPPRWVAQHDPRERSADALPPIAPVEPIDEELSMRTEVLEVDFGENTGAIFAVEDENGERYAVVWLADEKKNTEEERAIQ